MATHVVTPVTNQISLYGHPSPAPSNNTTPTTTTDNSPTSPRLSSATLNQLPLQSRQLRPPKAPLYVPAALRPTERPQKHSPPTPPRSVHGSLDSLSNSDTSETHEPISRRSTMESTTSSNGVISKLAEDEWMKNEHLGSVTGLPTRDHWKADSASSNCDSPTCRSSFGLFLRRHHCRHCGHVFCSSHTPHLVPLDQNARFHPDGVPSRACDLCWHAFSRWEESRTERLSKIQSVLDAQQTGPSEISQDSDASDASQEDTSKSALTPPLAQPGEIAASVPRGWNWSTF
ncbi:hypothetical protein SI65_08188 [Aspergillus cristatus]|uniref:FYVE-type domain-containing protein n=1 Tax=Aspergillus cristatus TaxID=573508 RepID=A0A1E3B5H3_ASPCR|nr:hypothetical protein SI65_08188 [Aspergillus cristatus]